MKKIITTFSVFALVLSSMLSASFAAAATNYGDSVVSVSQGTLKNASPITDPLRTDPNKALGAPDTQFFALGYDGQLVLRFATLVGGTLSIGVYETTNGVYPTEKSLVEVSADGSSWTTVGEADNTAGDQNPHASTFELGAQQCIQYVRLTDTTDPNLHDDLSDGFDVDAVSAEYTEECQRQCEAGPVEVSNSNTAVVGNVVVSRSSTGGNYAGGADTGNGGSGGDIDNGDSPWDDGDVEDSTTGNGGNSGSISGAASGGYVETGSATSDVAVGNDVNRNSTRVSSCGCCCSGGSVTVRNRNRAIVLNVVGATTNTGDNAAKGADTGNGGGAGDIDNDGDGDVEDSDTGNGGTSGSISGEVSGGTVISGPAASTVTVVNVVNRNRVRVR